MRRLVAPVTAVGSIALSAYVGHILAIKALGTDILPGSPALPVYVGFALTAMLLALIWTRFFRRGPLEYLMHVATRPALLIR